MTSWVTFRPLYGWGNTKTKLYFAGEKRERERMRMRMIMGRIVRLSEEMMALILYQIGMPKRSNMLRKGEQSESLYYRQGRHKIWITPVHIEQDNRMVSVVRPLAFLSKKKWSKKTQITNRVLVHKYLDLLHRRTTVSSYRVGGHPSVKARNKRIQLNSDMMRC